MSAVLLTPMAPASEVVFDEDFEGETHAPIRIAHTNGGDVAGIKVHHFGTSEQATAAGKRSFKIDLTIPSGDDVHCTIPLDLPFTRDLVFEGKVRAEGIDVRLGFYYRMPAASLAGLVYRPVRPQQASGDWRSWRAHEPRLCASAHPLFMQALVIYIRPVDGAYPWRFDNTRVMVFVDDLKVTARPLAADEETADVPELDGDYALYPIKAITDEKVLSSSPVIPRRMRPGALTLTAARDEYESASFVVLAEKELTGRQADRTSLREGPWPNQLP